MAITPLVKSGLLSAKTPVEAAASTDANPVLESTQFVRQFAEQLGISVAELHQLAQSGQLDQSISTEMLVATHLALQELMLKLQYGELEPETLVKIVSEFSKTAQKLGNREIQKQMIIDVSKLEKLLEED